MQQQKVASSTKNCYFKVGCHILPVEAKVTDQNTPLSDAYDSQIRFLGSSLSSLESKENEGINRLPKCKYSYHLVLRQ